MTDEELSEWLDKQFNQDREDWEGFGCYNCSAQRTHHADKSNIGTKDDQLYECKNCEFENGIITWLKTEEK